MARQGSRELAEGMSKLKDSPELRYRLVLVFGLFLVWLACNISLNLGVNYAMKARPRGLGFDFPLAFTMTHMFFSLAGCSLVMLLRPSQRRLDPRRQLPKYWARLICLSFFYVLAIAANNMSLMNVGLSINQIIKSCAPLPVLVMAYLLQGKVVPKYKLAAVVTLVCGAVLAVPYGHPVATWSGVLLAVLSTLSVGVKAVLSSILLDNAEESGLVPVVVAWYDALFSGVLLLLICSFTGDIPRMANYFLDPHKPWDAVLVFCALGTVAFFYNFVALAFIQATSALAIMIAGNFKHVLLILMPLVLYDHDPSHALGWTHKIGISLFFFSLFCCTAIDVYNTWHKAEPTSGAKAQRASAPPNEATPLYKGSEVAKGGDASDEWRDDWRDAEAAGGRGAPCLPCVPPRTS